MNLSYDLNLLTKYRTQLMGCAILWVVLFHSKPFFPDSTFFSFIESIGYGGVDIFLFLSGFGLYHSLHKNDSLKTFYKKRALRILPYYLPIVVAYSIYVIIRFNLSPIILIYNITTVSFWINLGFYKFDWYIPGLLTLYIITPFYFRLFKRNPIIATFLIVVAALLLSYLITYTRISYLLIFSIRIPIYFIGFLIGYYSLKNTKINTQAILLQIFLGIIGIYGLYMISDIIHNTPSIAWKYGLFWYPFILITFPLLLLLSSVLSLSSKNKYPILFFLGTYSLVIYLLHEHTLGILSGMFHTTQPIVLKGGSIILALVVGYFYQNIIDRYLKNKGY